MDNGRRRTHSLLACTDLPAHVFVGTYLFRIPAYTEYQLEQVDYWTSHSQLPIVGLFGLQTVSHYN